MAEGMKHCVIFADSRGRFLYNHLRHMNSSERTVKVFFYPGTKFITVCTEVDIVYVLAGVNDLTVKHSKTGIVTFECQKEDEMVSAVSDTICQKLWRLRNKHIFGT